MWGEVEKKCVEVVRWRLVEIFLEEVEKMEVCGMEGFKEKRKRKRKRNYKRRYFLGLQK